MMGAERKFKLAMYWAASCGGCEISVLNIGERLLEVDAAFDVVFWPVAFDFKYSDLRAYPDGYIDLCLFNGAIVNSENEEIAHLLRQKSKLLVAFGSCASAGGIPALANLTTRSAIFQTVYLNNPSIDNPDQVLPEPTYSAQEGELQIPTFYPTVKKLEQVVEIDYVIPGCPPEADQIWQVLQSVISILQNGMPLPPKGAVLGAMDTAVCKECVLEKHEKQIARFYRPYEIIPEPGLCLLEQGLVCLGPATRGGCGALCPKVGIGCRGCYGPLDGVDDQGARILAALSSVISAGDPKEEEQEIERKIDAAIGTLVDPAGAFYRFGMAGSLLIRARNGGSR